MIVELLSLFFHGVSTVAIITILFLIRAWFSKQEIFVNEALLIIEEKLDNLDTRKDEILQTDWESLNRAKVRLTDMGYSIGSTDTKT